ncbi:methyltransferase domain-containing protein [Allostreptomyces psammosilenae]|uniref:SAM-dependent methyltransferase n=1 Tax=Allostreptomyces psammosilenae TaxID=1892865 RepID=A0A852ZZI8_9ACTN|nr:methyltransferase domain-containing protein [Allostreptomyces psammosilenae]NYI03538.1 SAM-dependent methyltransferase [Allostreptomyces psammosilenae]
MSTHPIPSPIPSPAPGRAPAHPSDDTGALISRLDAVDERPDARALRQRSYALLGAGPGSRVVDVGCGAGRAVAELTELGARAVGVDVDPRMLGTARRRWPAADFRQADAGRLPFADGSLDGYRAEKVYHVLDAPARAAEEARRVLAPGGRAVLIGQDWDALVVDADDAELTRAIVHARADQLPSPRASRGYRGLLLDAGFRDVAVEAHTSVFTEPELLPMALGLAEAARAAGAIGPEQARAWCAEQTRRARTGRLLLAVPIFLAAGRRPA